MRLTWIGLSTAFALLLLIMFVVMLVGRLFGPGRVKASDTAASGPDESDAEDRDKALAAVLAVSAIMDEGDETEIAGGAGG